MLLSHRYATFEPQTGFSDDFQCPQIEIQIGMEKKAPAGVRAAVVAYRKKNLVLIPKPYHAQATLTMPRPP